MGLPEPFSYFITPLESAKIPYCITGSVAAGIYGETRTTKDIDFVLMLRLNEIGRFREAFPIDDYYVPPAEVLINELHRGQRGCLNLFHHVSGFKADLFFAVRDPLHLWAMKHRRRVAYGEEHIWVAPPEYVLLRKLEFFREGGQDKHIRDLRFMLAVTEMDRGFIATHLTRMGLTEEWNILQEAYRLTGGEALE